MRRFQFAVCAKSKLKSCSEEEEVKIPSNRLNKTTLAHTPSGQLKWVVSTFAVQHEP